MKKLSKILIALGIGLLVAGAIIWNWKHIRPNPNPNPTPSYVDTTKHTDVILKNWTNDSVVVYVTLQSGESILGKFGMDSSNIDKGQGLCKYINGKDTLFIPCHGKFTLFAGESRNLGYTKPLNGAIITFGAINQQCKGAIAAGWPNGVNNFEFSVNTWCVDGKVTGNNESFDITLVDGLHSYLQQSVTSFGPRVDSVLSPNYGAFWDFGLKDKDENLIKFTSSKNGSTFKLNQNIPGVYPYGCDVCDSSAKPPLPLCFELYPSTKWGKINTCQTNRQGQGGQVICEFFGFIGNPNPGKK